MADFSITLDELRAVTGFALACAQPALPLYERDHPDDPRPSAALAEARAFVGGGRRTKGLRVTAVDANRAARDASGAAAEAARAAANAAAAAYLHPLAKATQILHILASAAYAARAFELEDPATAADWVERARASASPVVLDVLSRYPAAPSGRGRVGELVRELDSALRAQAPPLAT